MGVTEEKIIFTTELDAKGLDAFRKGLNDQRNEVNAVAREVDKADKQYKVLKETVKELNRLRKLDDKDLRAYINSVQAETKAVTDLDTKKKNLTRTTREFSAISQTTTGKVQIMGNTLQTLVGRIELTDSSMANSVIQMGLFSGGLLGIATAGSIALAKLSDLGIEVANFNPAKFTGFMAEFFAKNFPDEVQKKKLINTPNENDPSLIINIPKEDLLDKIKPKEKIPKTTGRGSTPKPPKEVVDKVALLMEKIIGEYIDVTIGLVDFPFTFNGRTSPDKLQVPQKYKVSQGGGNEGGASDISRQEYVSGKLVEDSLTVYNNIQSLFGLFDDGTNKFINKMMSLFNLANSIGQGIGFIKTILGFLPGGSIASGALGNAPSLGGGGSAGSNSPIYLGSNFNPMQVYKIGRQQFNSFQSKTRVN